MGRKFTFRKTVLSGGIIDGEDALATVSFDLGTIFGGDKEVMWEHGYVGASVITGSSGDFGLRVLYNPEPGVKISLGGITPISGVTTYALTKLQGFGTALPMPQSIEIDAASTGESVGLSCTVWGTFYSAS